MNQRPTTPAWLISLVEEHFDELQMLLELRHVGLRDADYSEADIAELDERIEAHIDALVLAAEDAWQILIPGLSGDRVPASAATIALLRQGQRSADAVLDAMLTAEGPALAGIVEGMSLSRLEFVSARLKELYESGAPAQAAAAAEVFASHRMLTHAASRLSHLLADPDPFVRASAWRIVSLVDR